MPTTADWAATIKTAALKIHAEAAAAPDAADQRDLARVLFAVSEAMTAQIGRRIRFGEALRWSGVCSVAKRISERRIDPKPERDRSGYPPHMARRSNRR